MIELLREEIYNNRLYNVGINMIDSKWRVHCSKAVKQAIIKDFTQKGFLIDALPKGEEGVDYKFVKFQTPEIGEFEVYVDMEQGYKIEKYE